MKFTTLALSTGLCLLVGAAYADPASTPAAPAPAVAVNVAPPTTAAPATPDHFSSAQVTQIQEIVHSYLVANPQVLIEASEALQAQRAKAAEGMAMTGIEKNKAALFDDTTSPSLGSHDAPATVIEFFDYQCGHCREMAPTIKKLEETKQARIVFRELPIFGGVSQFAAKAALAAAKQHKYLALHNALLESKSPLTEESVMQAAKKAGLDVTQLKRDMKDASIDAQLKANFQLAQALNIMGTPTFVIGNKAQTKFRFIPGATTLKDLEDQIKSVE